MAFPRIVVVGSSNTDMVIKLDHIPQPGETILGGEFTTAAGGKGANQAVAAARAGGEVSFVARVGQDVLGDQAIAGFIKEGIHVEAVFRDSEAPSGVALIFVAKDGENCIAVASGANGRLSPGEVIGTGAAIAGADSLLMQLEIPMDTVQAAAEIASRARVPIILNPAPARLLPEKLLQTVTILTPNETEAEILTGISVGDDDSASKAAEVLLNQGVKIVVMTLGARGALVADGSSVQLIPGFPMIPVDTTAAGDVFNGALAVALGEGCRLIEAVRFANAAAAISVTRLGAQSSAPLREEINGLLGCDT